jgi:pilus assembly protein Flp/PilA
MSYERLGEDRPFAGCATTRGPAVSSHRVADGHPRPGTVPGANPRETLMLFVLNMIAAMHARVENAKDRGATATEYAMLVAFIALLIAGAGAAFGGQLSTWFDGLGDAIGIN